MTADEAASVGIVDRVLKEAPVAKSGKRNESERGSS